MQNPREDCGRGYFERGKRTNSREVDYLKNRAKELYQNGFGSLKKISEELGVPEATIKSWKNRDETEWLKPIKKVASGIKKDAPEKKVSKKIKDDFYEKVLNSDLTEKQRLFCIYYIQSFNATQSAIKAGYSKETATEQGCRLLRNVNVKEYLEELKELQSQELMLDTKRILNRHAQIAFSDIKNFAEFKTEKTVVGYEDDGRPIVAEMFNFKIKNDDEIDGTVVKKIVMGKFGPAIELEDRSKSLEFLTRFIGIDPKTEIDRQKLELEKEKADTDTGGDDGDEKILIEVFTSDKKRS